MKHPRDTITGLCAISAREMHYLYGKVQVLEDAVHDILDRGPKPTSQERQALQDFDLALQTLAGLAGFYERMEGQLIDTGDADIHKATDGVTLQKLRDRLREIGSLVDS